MPDPVRVAQTGPDTAEFSGRLFIAGLDVLSSLTSSRRKLVPPIPELCPFAAVSEKMELADGDAVAFH